MPPAVGSPVLMSAAPLPTDGSARLQSLHRVAVRDTPPMRCPTAWCDVRSSWPAVRWRASSRRWIRTA